MAGPSKTALDRLISQRLQPDADRDTIDAGIRARFEETWAVAFTDLVGFSRRTEEFGIIHFLSVIYRKGELLKPVVEDHAGLLLKEEADSWLILFRDPVVALEAMIACQHTCEAFNVGQPEEDQVQLCVGLGYGPLLKVGDDDVWGAEVNFASKLGEDIARRGEILLTDDFTAAVDGKLEGVTFERASDNAGSLDLQFHRTLYSAPGAR